MIARIVCIIELVAMTMLQLTMAQTLTIGLLTLSNTSQYNVGVRVARQTVDKINADKLNFSISLTLHVEEISANADSLTIRRTVCRMLEFGSVLLLIPDSDFIAQYATSMADHKSIPVISLHSSPLEGETSNAIVLHPSWKILSKVYAEVTETMKWRRVAILYEHEAGLLRLKEVIRYISQYTVRSSQVKMSYRVLKLPADTEFRFFMNKLKREGENTFIVDVSKGKVYSLLRQAQVMGMVTPFYSYFFTLLDFGNVNLEDFRYSGCNITAVRLVDPYNMDVAQIVYQWKQSQSERFPSLTAHNLTTESALIHDGIMLFARAMQDFGLPPDWDRGIGNCDPNQVWNFGDSAINLIKSTSVRGLTGEVHVDGRGIRNSFVVQIVQLFEQGLVPFGWYSDNELKLKTNRVFSQKDRSNNQSIHLFVSTILKAPYTMMKTSSKSLEGNNRYEGICVDLMEELSRRYPFNYTMFLNPKGTAGKPDEETGKWNGMIGDLLSKKADLALADLTITTNRTQKVNFTIPWMNLGISLLYVQPERIPSLFTFLSPFSKEVWIYLGIAMICMSILMFFVARLTPLEWESREYDQLDPILYNTVTWVNSAWFMIGSLMQQGSDVAPRAVSTRLMAATWWAFTLIMVSSYTANLAAFLTIETVVPRISSAGDLLRPENSDIKFGYFEKGSTAEFFKNSKVFPYDQIWKQSLGDRGILRRKDSDGVRAVSESKGTYAYFMESSSLEYYTARQCELTKVGSLLDNKGYGIAVARDSPISVSRLNEIIIRLQEEGQLEAWKAKWWEKTSGDSCEVVSKNIPNDHRLTLAQVGGVFLCLAFGLCIGLFCGIAQFVHAACKTARRSKTYWLDEVFEELRVSLLYKTRVARAFRTAPEAPVLNSAEVNLLTKKM